MCCVEICKKHFSQIDTIFTVYFYVLQTFFGYVYVMVYQYENFININTKSVVRRDGKKLYK